MPWAPLVAAMLHIVEEFFYPGGFADWDRAYRPEYSKSITSRFHIIINGLLLVLCYDVGALASKPVGPGVWLTVMTLLFTNAVWHVRGALHTRRYSPGMITGTLLYVPLTVLGYLHFLSSGQISISAALLAFAIGASYHLWFARMIHRMRTRRVKT